VPLAMGGTDPLATELGALQTLLREAPSEEVLEFAGTIPRDLRDEDSRSLFLSHSQRDVLTAAEKSVEADLRFELIAATYGEPYQEALWRFACLSVLRPEEDHVASFFAEHAREIEERTCYFPIEALTVAAPLSFQGLCLLPPDHDEVPPAEYWFNLDPPVGSVIAVPVTGTNLKLMKERARPLALHALRVIRIALRENRFINEQQLRFRLAETYSFGERLAGFDMRSDAAIGLSLDGGLLGLLDSEPVARLLPEPGTDLERRAGRAARWLEEAAFATDRVNAMLFSFFALESILGRRDQGLKARDLSFQRAMLSVAISEHFSDPDRAYRLYDEVRSDAVHGGEPELSESELRAFVWDIRIALKECLELAAREGFETRRRLLKYPDRRRLEEWLRDQGDPGWTEYFDRRQGG
jgi:hypothetical protein